MNIDYKIGRSTDPKIKTRNDLAGLFAEREYKIGAEIGVFRGEFAEVLCQSIPNLKYYGIDPWYTGDMKNHIHIGQYEQVIKKLAPYNATIIKKFSMDAVADFDNGSLDFVYIDANHLFDFVVNDVIEWAKKVRKGGIVAGHDYELVKGCGVVPAVDGYVWSHSHHLNLTTDTEETISWWFDKKWNG